MEREKMMRQDGSLKRKDTDKMEREKMMRQDGSLERKDDETRCKPREKR